MPGSLVAVASLVCLAFLASRADAACVRQSCGSVDNARCNSEANAEYRACLAAEEAARKRTACLSCGQQDRPSTNRSVDTESRKPKYSGQ